MFFTTSELKSFPRSAIVPSLWIMINMDNNHSIPVSGTWQVTERFRHFHQPRQPRLIEPDRHRVARHAGALDQIAQLRLRSLDQEPVADVLDQRAIRIPRRDVRQEKRPATTRQELPRIRNEKDRVPLLQVIEQAAREDQMKRRTARPSPHQLQRVSF